MVVNLWLGLSNLSPFDLASRDSADPSSDGWSILRLLRGKPRTPTLEEIDSARKPKTGLAYLKRHANRSRRIVVILLVLLGLMMTLPWLWLFGRPESIYRSVKLAMMGGSLAVGVMALVEAVRCSRKPWTSFIKQPEKRSANPLTQETNLFFQTIGAEGARIRSLDLPDDFLIRLLRPEAQQIPSAEFDQVLSLRPDDLLLHQFKINSLLHENRFEDAARALEPVLARDGLAPRVRHHLQTIWLSARLRSPEADDVAEECGRAAEEAVEDGPRMQRLLAFGSALANADRPEFLDLAERWLNQAQEIYPFDPWVHIGLGRLMLRRGNAEAAETWFSQAAEESADTGQADLARVLQAIAAAMAGRPKATALLRACLKQDLPFEMRQYVEKMIADRTPSG